MQPAPMLADEAPLRSHLDHVLSYVAQGHRVVLLHELLSNGNCSCGNRSATCPKSNGKDSSGKHPRQSGWRERLIVNAPAATRAWGKYPTANIGLCPRPGEFVLDIDPRNGGDETWARLVYELGEPIGPSAKTGGGGLHAWLRLPDGVDPDETSRAINAAIKRLGPGIDLRTHANQVVVEPSLHKSGKRYCWLPGRSVIECRAVVPSDGWLEALGLESASLTPAPRLPTPPPDPDDDLARAEWGLLHARLLDPDQGYDGWFRLGPALKCLGEAGLLLWIEASRPSKDFDEAEIRAKWSGITGSSIGSLFGMFDDVDPDWRQCYREYRDGQQQDRGAAPSPAAPVSEPIPLKPRASLPWPDPLGPAVRLGAMNDFLAAVEEQTEADPAAMAIDLLCRVGSAVHRGPHFMVSGDRHGCNLFAVIVGDTAQGRKGTSAAYPRTIMGLADPLWAGQCLRQGLSSGEGLIWAVRDPCKLGVDKKTGEEITDPGCSDKRLLVMETELARTLRAAARKENTLSPILRQAWEGGRLATMTKQPYAATDAHVSLLSHVTKFEFQQLVTDGDIAGGTLNRCLFVASRRQRELPFGGTVSPATLEKVGERLRQCIETARKYAGEMHFTPAARREWPAHYHELQADEQAPGIVGALLGRATAQVRRLAMVWAILDGSTEVDTSHIAAARELWRYSRQTICYVFGSSTGNQVADRILGELRGSAGVDRTQMHKLFGRHVTAAQINEALALLASMGFARRQDIPTAGRSKEVWFAVQPEGQA